MRAIRIVDVTDEDAFGLLPPCADPAFDHRTCDYWEDAERGSKAHRAGWLKRAEAPKAAASSGSLTGNPFAPEPREAAHNPFAPAGGRRGWNPFADDEADAPENPFAPKRPDRQSLGADAPRKLSLLGRGLAVFGSYAKVLLVGETPAGYVQFGPLSAYPRALRLRELYPQLPDSPLPAVITCIATTAAARDEGLALRLIEETCADLARRGFSAVEAYPEAGAPADATSAAMPLFWERAGFSRVVADERFPVYRLELA